MTTEPLAPDEPLSPELVLVLPPELRAYAIARLGDPVRPRTRQRAPGLTLPVEEPRLRSAGRAVGARVAQLAVIFLVVTVLTLAMTVVAQAVR